MGVTAGTGGFGGGNGGTFTDGAGGGGGAGFGGAIFLEATNASQASLTFNGGSVSGRQCDSWKRT